MFDVREGLRYTDDHEWILVDGKKAKFGITDYSQHEMNELQFIDIPGKGTHVTKGEEIGAMESTKSIESIYAPVSGTIIEVNPEIDGTPSIVNAEPYDGGWMAVIEMDDPAEADGLMDSAAYGAKINKE